MRSDASADCLAERNRDRVPDHAPQCLEMNRRPVRDERIGLGESLEDSPFSQGNCAVLFGVSKPSVPESIELGCQRRSGFVPGHPAVHAWISVTGFADMAVGDEVLWPIAPSSSRSRGLNSLEVQLREP
eukprot:gene13247-biopygen13473